MIAAMTGHTIVCGGGLMAQAVVERLMRKRSAVMIDSNADQLAVMKKKFRRLQTIEGNSGNELKLTQANVLTAKYVVAATDSEVDNLLIGITCKDIGNDICVIAESNDLSIANRMRKSGIDEVISPSQLGGERVTELVLAQR